MTVRWIWILALLAGPATAQVNGCIQINNDLDRLACYDLAAGRTPIQEVLETESSWNVWTETSAMTDDTNVFMSVESKEDVYCGRFRTPEPATLHVRCMENRTSVYYRAECHLTSSSYNDNGHITFRLDDTKARTMAFEVSSNNRALGLWSGRKAIPFAKAMFGQNQILMRVTPYGENAHTATFNIAGLKEAIVPLREACHW